VDGWPLAVPSAGFLGRTPFSGPLRWRMLLPGACLSMGWSELFQRLYITGTFLLAILMPLMTFLDFNDFRIKKWKMFSILEGF
jgi:hypothetical protein